MKSRKQQHYKKTEQYAFEKSSKRQAINSGAITSTKKIAQAYKSQQYFLFDAIPASLRRETLDAMPNLTKKPCRYSQVRLNQALTLSFLFYTANHLIPAVAAQQRVPTRVANLVETHEPAQEISAGYKYKSYFAEKHVTSSLQCTTKPLGNNPGKVCLIGQADYLLKAYTGKKTITGHIFKPEQTFYNQKILQKLNLITPNMKMIYEENDATASTSKPKGSFYLASEFLTGFTSIAQFIRKPHIASLLKGPSPEQSQYIFTTVLRNLVGEEEIQKFLLGATFVADLLNNVNNWGIVGNKIAVIDMDISYMKTSMRLATFADEISKMPIILSIRDLEGFKSKLEKLLKLGFSPDSVPDFKALSIDQLHFVITVLIEACNKAIHLVNSEKTDVPNPRRLNEVFAAFIQIIYDQHHALEKDQVKPRA